MTSTLERLTTALSPSYRVSRELGAGGMATVYLAHDLKHERDVAIKVLHPDLGAALGAERFLSEIKTTAKLQHPHILPLLDSGAADGLLYYVMPFVRGETLRARLDRERQLPLDDALRIAREVAGALDHAHKQGIIHRDIKPENILLQDGAAVVADFGIALAVQSAGGARMTQTGLSLGTPQYMSPEQAMGERTIDARSDIYALGAVTYEMLAGEPPFTGASVQAIVAKVMSAEPERLTLTRKSVPVGTEVAVLRALAKLPVDRYASAAAFAEALAADEHTHPFDRPSTAAALTASRRWLPVLIGATLSAVVTITVIQWRAGLTATSSSLSSAQVTFSGQTAVPALSADGDVLAYVRGACEQPGHSAFPLDFDVGNSEVPCRSSLVIQDSGTTTPVEILKNVLSITDVRWSADNSALFLVARLDSAREGLYQMPRLGGVARQIGPRARFDVHPVGDTLIAVPLVDELATSAFAHIVEVKGGSIIDSIRMPDRQIRSIAWSPDGKSFAVAKPSGIYLLRRDGTVLDSTARSVRRTMRWNVDGTALLIFRPAPARDDELVAIPVLDGARFGGEPRVLLPRMQTLYRGDFDVARKSGRVALVSGDAVQDLWSFPIQNGAAAVGRQQTRGTSWYGTPAPSPDGQRIYYSRGDALGDNMYELSLASPGLEEQPLSASLGIGFGAAPSLSVSGARLIFLKQPEEGTYIREVNELDVPRRVVRKLTTYQPNVPFPIAQTGMVDLRRNGDSLVVFSARDAAPLYIVAPDSMRIVSMSIGPDEREAAVVASSGGTSVLGVLSLSSGWKFRVLVRFDQAAPSTYLSWTTSGLIYFARWSIAAGAPVLYRVLSTGGAVTPVMAVPPRCWVQTVSVARAAPVGTCQTHDFRSDVYLLSVPGVTR
ncbi:serine/threonine-protein kinase [Gemmatimonas groenlandica]|uniref:non-specific serine/threonine protein kinase n=1 Tax=Gemmatimonas groenlandica TaxID=2732249 RepID=A0A6M4IT21_9BACT|nr:serine/threonine protein kinase [Gemmatimonas groenlandica]